MIDVKDLQAFLSIIDCGSISKAAEDIGLTQPALSLKLKKMEAELGVSLFQRTSRNVVALESAKIIAPQARYILSHLEGLKEILASSIDEITGTVKIGCLTGWFDSILLPAVQEMQKDAPNIECRLHVAQTHELIDMVAHGKTDFAVVAQPFEKIEGIEAEYLLDEKLALVGHNLPQVSEHHEWKEFLLGVPWITMTVPDPLVEKWWREHFDEPFPWADIKVPCSVDYITKLPLILKDYKDAVAVIPRQIVQPLIDDNLLQKSNLFSKKNKLYLIWRSGGIQLKRYELVKNSIANRAQEILEEWAKERAIKRNTSS